MTMLHDLTLTNTIVFPTETLMPGYTKLDPTMSLHGVPREFFLTGASWKGKILA
jgi:hypothetical protein